MRLIPDLRQAWRYYSVQALSLLALLPAIWAMTPPEVQELIPVAWRPWILAAVALGGLAGRLVDQHDV